MMVSSYSGFNDPAAMGNTLADYYDQGGHVVITLFAVADYGLSGRWISGGYNFLSGGSYQGTPQHGQIQIFRPSSSVLVGVSTLTADSGPSFFFIFL